MKNKTLLIVAGALVLSFVGLTLLIMGARGLQLLVGFLQVVWGLANVVVNVCLFAAVGGLLGYKFRNRIDDRIDPDEPFSLWDQLIPITLLGAVLGFGQGPLLILTSRLSRVATAIYTAIDIRLVWEVYPYGWHLYGALVFILGYGMGVLLAPSYRRYDRW